MKYSKKKSSTYLPIALSIGVCATSMSVAVAAAPTSAYASEQPAQPASLTAPANKDAVQKGASNKEIAPQKENQIKDAQVPAASSSKQLSNSKTNQTNNPKTDASTPSNTKNEASTEDKATKSALNTERSVSSTDTTANATPASTSTPTPEQVKNMAGCMAEYKDENGIKYLVIKPKDNATEGVISADLKKDDFKQITYVIRRNQDRVLKFEGKIYGYGSIAGLFSDANIKSLGNIAKFDVSNVTDMSYLFSGCKNLSDITGLKDWNTGNVTTMKEMFAGQLGYYQDTKIDGCEKLTNVAALEKWDTSKVTDMSYMFSGCKNLSDISGLKNWKTGNVTTMQGMFGGQVHQFAGKIDGCTSLTDVSALKTWDTSKVTDMSYMFSGCKKLSDIEGLKDWNTSNVTTVKAMFGGQVQKHLSPSMGSFSIVNGCEKLTDVAALEKWDTSKVTDMAYLFFGCANLSDISGLRSWHIGSVTTMRGMFAGYSDYFYVDFGKTKIISISACEKLTSLKPLAKWNTSNVTDMSYMFSGCKGLESLAGLEEWKTENLRKMRGMFSWYCIIHSDDDSNSFFIRTAISGNQSLNDISALSKWNTSNVTDMSYLFFGCKNLSDISALSNWNTKNVTTMQGMFAGFIGDEYPTPTHVPGCEGLTNLDKLSDWDTSNVTDMSYLFFGCKNLENLAGLKNWNTSKVTNMYCMFVLCEKLRNVDEMANWDVQNVTDMSNMFDGCKSLENLNGLKGWKTNKNLIIACMFSGCENLTDISGIKDWNISVNPADGPLRYVFARCMKLTDISPIQSWADKFYEDSYYGSSSSEMFGYRTSEYLPLTFTNIKWLRPRVFFDVLGDSEGATYIFNVGNTTDKEIIDYFNSIKTHDNPGWDNLKYYLDNNLVITNNDVLLNTIKGQKADGEKAHFVTVKYGTASEKTHIPAVLDSRINGKDSAPSTDAVEIVKHYIPGAVAEGAKTLHTKDAKVPTDYIAVAEKELTSDAKLSDLFQTYTIKAAHTVTFMDEKSKVTTLKVEAGKKIADLAGETIVTSDAVLTGVTMPNAPVKDGYTFKEWNTKADGSGTSFTKDSVVDADQVVYAQYTKNVVPTPEPMPEPEPIPEPEPMPEPTPTPERTTQIQKTTIIPFTTNYVANTSLAFKQQVIKVYGVNGKVVTTSVYQIDETQPNQLGKLISTHEDITPAVNCLIEVGNKEVIKNDDGSTTIKVYKVDPSTGRLSDPTETSHAHNEPAVLDTQEVEVLPAKMVYVADETLPFNTKKKISDPVDGLKVTTHTGSFVNGVWVPRDEVEITAAKDGLTKVGNKEVIKNDDGSTTIKVYKVDPSTGRLIRVISTYTTMPLTNLKKHMKQTPKTGDEGSWGALLSTLGFSLASFAGVLRARKKHTNK